MLFKTSKKTNIKDISANIVDRGFYSLNNYTICSNKYKIVHLFQRKNILIKLIMRLQDPLDALEREHIRKEFVTIYERS